MTDDETFDSPAFDEFAAQALVRLQALTEAQIGLFRLDDATWDVDQTAGTITFVNSGGIRATAPVQIIGTYNTADGTWLWGWDHPSVLEHVAEAAKVMHAYGRVSRSGRNGAGVHDVRFRLAHAGVGAMVEMAIRIQIHIETSITN